MDRLPLRPARPSHAYLFATLFCLTSLALRLVADRVLPDGYPYVSFFPAVILSCFLFGVRAGVYAALLCGILAWYFFIPPRYSFTFSPAVAMGLAFYSMVASIDIVLIHWMQRANADLAVERERSRTLAENRELLFRELQHRVSNNLQVVAGMLSLQRRHVDNDVARHALDDASARLGLVGKISRALYNPSGEGQDVRAFLTTLSTDVVEASGRTDIALRVDAPAGLTLDPNIMVPMALIVAEAVSNAIEHGLPDRAGRIHVEMETDEGLHLRIMDDGHGVAPDFDMTGNGCLGLRIAHALARQLDGRFRLAPAPGGGAVAQLDLPAVATGPAERR